MRPIADAALFWVGFAGLACFIVLLGTGIVIGIQGILKRRRKNG